MGSRRTLKIAVGAAVALALAGGAAAYFTFFDGSEPAPVGFNSPEGSGTFDGDFNGSWTMDTQSGSFEESTSRYAGYRVEEELGGIGANTAVGRTPNVSGSLEVDGTTIAAISVSVDMTTLVSDDDRRDNAIRTRGLETSAFPTATFELTEPIEIGSTPEAGDTFDVEAVGDLTLHGVTQRVTVPIQARWTGNRIEALASFAVALADYDIDPPTGFSVLSIADTGTIELHLLFQKA
jgi:polyisoprenoid-binding protein YceI